MEVLGKIVLVIIGIIYPLIIAEYDFRNKRK